MTSLDYEVIGLIILCLIQTVSLYFLGRALTQSEYELKRAQMKLESEKFWKERWANLAEERGVELATLTRENIKLQSFRDTFRSHYTAL